VTKSFGTSTLIPVDDRAEDISCTGNGDEDDSRILSCEQKNREQRLRLSRKDRRSENRPRYPVNAELQTPSSRTGLDD
jgi:hypothetical protein